MIYALIISNDYVILYILWYNIGSYMGFINMAVNFRHQDLAYTIISRFEESLRLFIEAKLNYMYTNYIFT